MFLSKETETRIDKLEWDVRQLSRELLYAKEDATRAKERAASAELKLGALLEHLGLEVEHHSGYQCRVRKTKKASK